MWAYQSGRFFSTVYGQTDHAEHSNHWLDHYHLIKSCLKTNTISSLLHLLQSSFKLIISSIFLDSIPIITTLISKDTNTIFTHNLSTWLIAIKLPIYLNINFIPVLVILTTKIYIVKGSSWHKLILNKLTFAIQFWPKINTSNIYYDILISVKQIWLYLRRGPNNTLIISVCTTQIYGSSHTRLHKIMEEIQGHDLFSKVWSRFEPLRVKIA